MGLPSSDDFHRLEAALTEMQTAICDRLDLMLAALGPRPVVVHVAGRDRDVEPCTPGDGHI